MRIHPIGLVLSLASGLALSACSGKQTQPEMAGDSTGAAAAAAAAAPQTSLYERLGKLEAIDAVVGDFLANVTANHEINHFFKNSDPAHLKKMLVEQICEVSGGPCKYTGKDMRTVHTGMKITEAEFNSMVGDLVKSLDKLKVGEREKSELLGALGGMKGDIVGL
jgi:hemoglobin